jgi:hypothetical protein
VRVGPQTSCLLGQPLRAHVGEAVVPAQPALDDLLTVELDQAILAEAIERGVERAGPQPNPPV